MQTTVTVTTTTFEDGTVKKITEKRTPHPDGSVTVSVTTDVIPPTIASPRAPVLRAPPYALPPATAPRVNTGPRQSFQEPVHARVVRGPAPKVLIASDKSKRTPVVPSAPFASTAPYAPNVPNYKPTNDIRPTSFEEPVQDWVVHGSPPQVVSSKKPAPPYVPPAPYAPNYTMPTNTSPRTSFQEPVPARVVYGMTPRLVSSGTGSLAQPPSVAMTPTSAFPPHEGNVANATALPTNAATVLYSDSCQQASSLTSPSNQKGVWGVLSDKLGKRTSKGFTGLSTSLNRVLTDLQTKPNQRVADGATLNGYQLSTATVQWFAAAFGFKVRSDTAYWYDQRSGWIGKMGGRSKQALHLPVPCMGTMDPQCSAGDTGIFINDRQLPADERVQFMACGMPLQEGCRYTVDMRGNVRLMGRGSSIDGVLFNWKQKQQQKQRQAKKFLLRALLNADHGFGEDDAGGDYEGFYSGSADETDEGYDGVYPDLDNGSDPFLTGDDLY